LREVLAKLPSPQSLASELGRLQVPALVLVGAEDRESLAPSRALAEALPNAEFLIVPDAGHIVNLAQPAVFNAAVEKFLREKIELAK
jgi:pimeloyl-ACP methyl ester carboxylesterase